MAWTPPPLQVQGAGYRVQTHQLARLWRIPENKKPKQKRHLQPVRLYMQNRNTEEKTGSESDDASDEKSLSESPLEDSEAASVFSKACPAKSARFNGLLACMSKNSSWISHSSQNVNPLDLYSTRLMWLPLIARHTHTRWHHCWCMVMCQELLQPRLLAIRENM